MSWLSSALHPANPADAAMPYYQQIPGQLHQYYDPFVQSGTDALSTLQQQYSGLLSDPGAQLASIGAGFQQSPGYQFQYDQAMQAAKNQAAAGGLSGSPASQQQAAQLAQNLASQDYNQYMNQALGLYGKGLSGTQGLETQGYGASTALANALAGNLAQQGNLAYAGQAQQNKAAGDLMSGALGLGTALLTAPLTGGTSLLGFGANQLMGAMGHTGSTGGSWYNPDSLMYDFY